MIDSLIADSFCHSEIMTGTRMSKLLQWFKLPWLVASSSMLFAESPALDSIFQSSNLFHFFISKFQCLLSLYAASTYFSLLHWKSPRSFVKSQIKEQIQEIRSGNDFGRQTAAGKEWRLFWRIVKESLLN